METKQNIFIKAKNSEYLHNIIQKKDWDSLIKLASARNAHKDLLFRFFQTDQSITVLNNMTEDQIFNFLDVSPLCLEEAILARMELMCDSNSKFSNIALKLMKELYSHGGDFNYSSIIKCLPLNVIKLIIDSRIPCNKFHFGTNKQEFFMYIISSINTKTTQSLNFNNFNYKNLKESDCSGEIFTYIKEEIDTFPLGRRDVLKEVIKSLNEAFSYIESNDRIEYDSILIEKIIDPLFSLITNSLQNKVYDYKNDKEIIDLLTAVFDEYYSSKFFLSKASNPILNNSGNFGLFQPLKILEKCRIIKSTFYYKVFKRAVEINKDNFVDKIVGFFFTSCPIIRYVRELNDGIYDKLFNASIEFSVKEIIEKQRSSNFSVCCNLLSNDLKEELNSTTNRFVPKFDECLLFINSVILKVLDKKDSLNVDYSSFPEICCYILNALNGIISEDTCLTNYDILIRKQNKAIFHLYNDINEDAHRPIDFIDSDIRNKLVLSVIRHPVDKTKFSSIITSNNPTFLVKFICYFESICDFKLVLSEDKREKVDKFGFVECKNCPNSNDNLKLNIFEIFLRTLRFWENNDKTLFRDGYITYYQFVRKILIEAIRTNDEELKKLAISVYYRFCETVSLIKNAKYLCFRMHIASLTFLTPLAVIIGSELDEKFVEKFVAKYIRPFNSQSYQYILSEVLSRSHLDINYYEDEIVNNELDETDQRFRKIFIDQQFAIATKLLLELIKENPVRIFHLYYTSNLTDCVFISRKRFVKNIKEKFEILHPKIIDICNPLKTENSLSIEFNSPKKIHVYLDKPQYKLSGFVIVEIARFLAKEFKEYSPLAYKTKSTKQLRKIQTFLKKLIGNVCNTFRFVFTLDEPTIDTIQSSYFEKEKCSLNVLYSHSFFDFLNEINDQQKSIFNDESFEIIRNALIARFVSEKEFLKLKNQPFPKFTGFNVIIEFKRHQNAINIFNEIEYKKMIEEYEFSAYQKVHSLNQKLIKQINQVYNVSKFIPDNPIDDNFTVDLSVHRNRIKRKSDKNPDYPMNVHKCFTKIMDALNKSKSESFVNDFECLERLNTFKPIKNCGSDSNQYSMLTHLLDLLINNFTLSKSDLIRSCKNCIINYEDIYRYMTIVARIASPNIGPLKSLSNLCNLKETVINERVPNINLKFFEHIFKCGNVDQILTCMNSYLFVKNAPLFHKYLQKSSGLVYAKEIINGIINEIVNNGKQILDVFHVALAKCSIYPRFFGFPAPLSSLEYLKMITNKSISVKRASCANAVYYAIMNFISGNQIPFKEINEIIESTHHKSPDEITAFFCLLISKEVSLNKMISLPALNDLLNENALPESFIINQGPNLTLLKEIGEIYYNCIEKVILSGLKSNKQHIYELTVTVLNEINVGPEIQRIISPFIEKGLKQMQPNDDNEAFFKYATSFAMKNPEFKECFNSYCDALTMIKNHSFAILKANTSLNQNSPYPQSFKKLDHLLATIMNIIEKPFEEFKDDNDMISASVFCRNLLPVLRKNKPAISLDVFLRLEGIVSIFSDILIEEIVNLKKQDKKDQCLLKFIVLITHHDEILFGIPNSITQMYLHLKSAFSIMHTIELSKNLAQSNLELQRNYQLAALLSPDVISHMPNEQSIKDEKMKGVEIGIENEDEIIKIFSNLGIYCKKEVRTFPFKLPPLLNPNDPKDIPEYKTCPPKACRTNTCLSEVCINESCSFKVYPPKPCPSKATTTENCSSKVCPPGFGASSKLNKNICDDSSLEKRSAKRKSSSKPDECDIEIAKEEICEICEVDELDKADSIEDVAEETEIDVEIENEEESENEMGDENADDFGDNEEGEIEVEENHFDDNIKDAFDLF